MSTGTSAPLTESTAKTGSRSGKVPGEVGVWVFIFGDLTVFSYVFITFLFYRGRDLEGYQEGRDELLLGIGVINTVVLLCSSLLVVLALQRARSDARRPAQRLVVGAMALGVVFVVLKVAEYVVGYDDGHRYDGNGFFSFYYILTGLHLIHLTLGLVALLVMHRVLARPLTAGRHAVIEGGACYWHMVDFLWIVIFPLLYVLS